MTLLCEVREGYYLLAITWYGLAIERPDVELKLKIAILSNVSQSFLSLDAFNMCLLYAEKILELDKGHQKSLYRKAKCLAYLGDYVKSIKIFNDLKENGLKCDKEIQEVQALFEISEDRSLIESFADVLKDTKCFPNYCKSIEIKISPGKGRGIFATADIKKGQDIIVENSLATFNAP